MEPVSFAPKRTNGGLNTLVAPSSETLRPLRTRMKSSGTILLDQKENSQPKKPRMASKAALSMPAVRWREPTPTHVWVRAQRKVGEV